MKQELKKYPKMKLVHRLRQRRPTTATQVTQGLLQHYPNLKGIISPTTVGIRPRPRSLDTSKYKGKVALTGLGTPEPDAGVRQGRHGPGVRAVEPGRPRLPGRVRGGGPRLRRRSPAAGADVQRRQARRVHDRRGRHRPARPAATSSTQPTSTSSTSDSTRSGPGRTHPGPARQPRRQMERVCFPLRVRPDRLDEYRERPRRRVAGDAGGAARRRAGATTRSSCADDGLLVGYLETDDFAAAQAAMAATEVNARWQAEMAGFFVDLDGRPADQGSAALDRGLPPRLRRASEPPQMHRDDLRCPT